MKEFSSFATDFWGLGAGLSPDAAITFLSNYQKFFESSFRILLFLFIYLSDMIAHILQILASIISAVLTALGTTSCMGLH